MMAFVTLGEPQCWRGNAAIDRDFFYLMAGDVYRGAVDSQIVFRCFWHMQVQRENPTTSSATIPI